MIFVRLVVAHFVRARWRPLSMPSVTVTAKSATDSEDDDVAVRPRLLRLRNVNDYNIYFDYGMELLRPLRFDDPTSTTPTPNRE